MNESDLLKQLAEHGYDTVDFLSAHRKEEREQLICSAFLRCLGVDFQSTDLISSRNDPPDVVYRDAQFEVMLELGGRKLHEDWKNEAKRRKSANSLIDLATPYQSPVPLNAEELERLLTHRLEDKAKKYGQATCATLDVLVYVNLRGRYLWPVEQVRASKALLSQGWRTVCYLFTPYSQIVLATKKSPSFLKVLMGRPRNGCQNPGEIFS